LKVNSHKNLSFHNNYTFLKKIDQLPTGPEWICDIITVTGNTVDDNGVRIEENVEVWRRDPVECVKELMGNPAFKDYMSYIAERVYLDNGGKVRIFDEMWTADWWWNIQVSFFDLRILRIETNLVLQRKCFQMVQRLLPLSYLQTKHS
jgi:hypothetical protein